MTKTAKRGRVTFDRATQDGSGDDKVAIIRCDGVEVGALTTEMEDVGVTEVVTAVGAYGVEFNLEGAPSDWARGFVVQRRRAHAASCYRSIDLEPGALTPRQVLQQARDYARSLGPQLAELLANTTTTTKGARHDDD